MSLQLDLKLTCTNNGDGKNPELVYLLTFILGNKNYEGDGWAYPSCVEYKKEFIISKIKEKEFDFIESNWYHPKQTWFLLFHPSSENAKAKISKSDTFLTKRKSILNNLFKTR